MIAAANKKQVRVSADETVGLSVTVPVTQLDLVRGRLAANHVRFWVDHHATSIDGKPPSRWSTSPGGRPRSRTSPPRHDRLTPETPCPSLTRPSRKPGRHP